MKPNDAEICSVGNFEPDFQHVPLSLVQFF